MTVKSLLLSHLSKKERKMCNDKFDMLTPDSIELTPGWTEQQVNEVKRLFGGFNFNKCYIPLIRL